MFKPLKLSRVIFSPIKQIPIPPNLLQFQRDSYKWFLEKGLKELLEEFSPIEDFSGRDLALYFEDYYFEEPKCNEETAKQRNAFYEASLRVKCKLVNKRTGEIKEQEVFLGDFPLMTDRGTFIINGIERCIVSQIVRSPGIYFTLENLKGYEIYFGAKIIPSRGAWLEFETDFNNVIWVKIDKKRKVPATTLLRAFGYNTDNEILKLFENIEKKSEKKHILATLEKDETKNEEDALLEIYKRLRPGDLPSVESAKSLIYNMFFNLLRYDFTKVGRFKINKRLKRNYPLDIKHRVLLKQDIIDTITEIIRLNNEQGEPDDIDHLSNRRVRSVGELLQTRLRIGFARMQRMIRDRMSTCEIHTVTPAQLVNPRPVIAVLREFFLTYPLSQFMDQTNPLSELEHKRRMSALGPGGLTKERAGFEVRDVHRTHYGKICPIQTPEGQNIGVVTHLATYAKLNELGFLMSPYRKVINKVKNDGKSPIGEILGEEIRIKGRIIGKRGHKITREMAKILKTEYKKDFIKIQPKVTDKICYLTAEQEEKVITTPATTPVDENKRIILDMVPARKYGKPYTVDSTEVEYQDISPFQIVSISTSLIPFLEHNDAVRALMGSNMQRQAVPCVKAESPIVGTGMEKKVAEDSGYVILAEDSGKVIKVDAKEIVVKYDKLGEKVYKLKRFNRSNSSTCIDQVPRVNPKDLVKKGDLLADGPSIKNGELALGHNILVAFMAWEGGNYEDAILISERLVQQDKFLSIAIKDYTIDVRETKLGPEIVTRDIPNVSEERLRNLDDDGIVRIGAFVKSGDILVGKITPKGETELSAEEKLLRAIFGEKAKDVRDTSLYLEHGEYGKVIDVKEFSREKGDKLPSGVIKSIQVTIACLRKIQVGDKLAGRHGNKGVISRIVKVEDMPHLEDGTPIDIILSPLGVASRMNLGQILETHLGICGKILGNKYATIALAGLKEEHIKQELKKAGWPEDGKVWLYDGRTGERFKQRITVGIMYIMKLNHMVEDKIHQRSIGPYSLITQQPLGGRSRFGGQRFGEMEVWALEGYGAAYTLQEMLTIKSDDVKGRAKAYEAIIKGEKIKIAHIPESFNVLVKELKSLSLEIELLKDGKIIPFDKKKRK